MRITLYQANAKMMWEAQRVIHQQNMEQLAKLNRQADQQQKCQEVKTQWIKAHQVDVYA